MGEFAAVGLILPAKSILRFNGTQKSEYVLIGTLLSFGFAALQVYLSLNSHLNNGIFTDNYPLTVFLLIEQNGIPPPKIPQMKSGVRPHSLARPVPARFALFYHRQFLRCKRVLTALLIRCAQAVTVLAAQRNVLISDARRLINE